ncbi:cytochrome P450 [Roridomyces roridus]|uniref:Cytochrome P450 n=1 Tax=Roridomyces roridus TaxID=1738132 RepID=A0AAD7CAP8_9AGAR|nr:cytochrome P450 [Roridomyces roridus]
MAFLLYLAALWTLILFTRSLLRRYARLPYPPGPRPRFLIGNLLDMPAHLPWLTYTEWGKQYGDIIHTQIFNQHFIILNSAKIAVDLLEKRASIYSDRPVIPMISLMGWDFNLGLIPYGDKWRQYRRVFHQYFRRKSVPVYHPIQLRKVHNLLRGLVSTPQDFYAHTKTYAAAIIMAAVYGYDIQPVHDRFVDLSEDAVQRLGDATAPGVFLLNSFPFLRHMPSWLPGCGFHLFAQETREILAEMQNATFDLVRDNMRDGLEKNSILGDILGQIDASGGSSAQEKVAKEVAATSYAADTTSSTLNSFFLAMAMNPGVQRKAQAEIDAAIGFDRLPTFEDRSRMPYVEAIYRELMRWSSALPLGVLHASTEDDVYDGYYIPKGTAVFTNIWAMGRDESVYHDADKFIPERFINSDDQLDNNDTILGFGFGRRICVGRHFAEAVVWLTVASVLSAFDIQKAKDSEGNDIDLHPVYLDGMVSPIPMLNRTALRSREKTC